jgi:DNA-binding response OmpR family regulator
MGLLKRLRDRFFAPPRLDTRLPSTHAGHTAFQERRRKPRIDARKGARVLIIDDSPTILAVLRKMFISAGYNTHEALNADHGMQMMRTSLPDLVVLDVIMPGTNGFAALRQMRRDPDMKDVPVIMMSGNEQATEQFYLMRIGADGFMKKPFTRYDVFSRIEGLLDEKRVPRRS